jgi:isocitrate lyase
MLQYFWEEKRDITCWTEFENALPRIESEFPELARAWRAAVAAPRILTAVLYYLRSHSEERLAARALTEQELSDLWWAWTDRADLTYASWFDAKIPALERDYPELVKAWHDYQTAQKQMDRAMERASRLERDLED